MTTITSPHIVKILKLVARLTLLQINLMMFSCHGPDQTGDLVVSGQLDGTYEVYRVTRGSVIQFVSKQLGKFNEPLPLLPGRYLLLADCSHRFVDITKSERRQIVVHAVVFAQPTPMRSGDNFTIQCSRFEKTLSRQSLKNQFHLNILRGNLEVLIGMTPFTIPPLPEDVPVTKRYVLSSIEVSKSTLVNDLTYPPYFVSPAHDLLGITQAQAFNSRMYLLPGSYHIFVSGTKMLVNLKQNESRKIEPILFRANTPSTSFSEVAQIEQFSYDIDKSSEFLFNHVYPVISSEIHVSFPYSTQIIRVKLKPNILNELSSRILLVDTGCSLHEWECLGKREIVMLNQDSPFPYIKSRSDYPILFSGDRMVVGVEGSKGLKYELSPEKNVAILRTGRLKVTPRIFQKAGVVTDLLRLEAVQKPHLGYSNDIAPDRATTFTLIAGTYALIRYTSTNDSERHLSKKNIVVRPGQITSVEIDYYLSEHKMSKLKSSSSQSKSSKRNKQITEQTKVL